MSSPLTRFNQGSPEHRAEMIKFLQQQLIARQKEQQAIYTSNPARMVELGFEIKDLQEKIKKLQGK